MGIYRQAIKELAPTSKFSFNSSEENYETLHWKDFENEPPSKDDVEKKVKELQPIWDEWLNNRKNEYPTLEDQLDLLWHTVNSGQYILPGCSWFEKIKNIKEKYPKPE